MRSQRTHRCETDITPLLVVKLGGSLADHVGEIIPVFRAARRPLLIVPGGGAFADAVRQSGAMGDAAHWMACAAMDQYGWLLSAEGMKTTTRIVPQKSPRILLPYCALRRFDPLPHSWDVTSDTIAAWVAGMLSGDLLVLKSVDGIISSGKVIPHIEGPMRTSIVDPLFVPFIFEHRIRTFILNGTDPARIEKWLGGDQVPGTGIGTTF